MSVYGRSFKRVIDFVVALTLLCALLPFGIVLWLLVRWKLGTPAFFLQERPGRDERLFRMVKFRTMTNATGPDGALLPDDRRITKFGLWLRKTSLDELPELWNVLKGEMSLVGPRPLLIRYLPYYTKEERLRFLVRPGITGLAQTQGRNLMSWSDRLACDIQYVNNLSFMSDLKILIATPLKVLKSSGVVDVPGNAMQDLDAERRGRPSR